MGEEPYYGPDFGLLQRQDPELARVLLDELDRQRTGLQLVAGENFTSPAVLAAMGSTLTNKYAEGYPGRRYYGGCEVVDRAERMAVERARRLFGAEHANVQPHSGASANLAAYAALLQPGDTMLAMALPHGGHFTHGSKVNFSGRWFDVVSYGVRRDTETIDYDEVRDLALRHQPKLIVCGATAYPRLIDFSVFRGIADEVGAWLMADVAHTIGLMAGGAIPSAVPHADVVTFTTHKALRGPRGGAILCTDELAARIDRAVYPFVQGGPLMHVIAAKAVGFAEAMRPEFAEYARRVVVNARALTEALAAAGMRPVSGGTDTHLALVDLRPLDVSGAEAERRCAAAGITLNRNVIPYDPEPASVTSGIRVGTPCATTQGMGPEELREVGGLVAGAVCRPGEAREIRERIAALLAIHRPYLSEY
ncbi:aminotransferase class I/II-fold pyridoxal phosphate-dependent enzyme [Nonomuraea phyllanthi]|uniref:Serine hydroxymethyltransferase n=1 Tax=Nonomuraea phyllanthi TaxID=2219224 RepID=A0A5C4WX91_9ACTN|nr:serine hydroxymethyltransferase [Nonomuraea phyllanthi]KAB8197259.1 aminotransferase class I/II-fold pyridoxal phosphate-dependent enzyme [Nonomuraea phyllanthi]QFY06744.1 aminotransferase class I/II-fold pyridoxal phosphate-dependent enzyme [Nonomuraea phyllanthi]